MILRPNHIPGVLAETQLFHTIASSYLGGTVTMETLQAIDRFVRDCKIAGVWDKLLEVYPICGPNILAAAVKLKFVNSNLPNLALINMTVSDYAERGTNGGLLADGATKYVDCQFPTNLVPAAAHLSVYLREDISTISYIAGANNGAANDFIGMASFTGANRGVIMGGTQSAGDATPMNKGFYYGERVSATDLRLYFNNAQIGVTNTTNTVPAYTAANLFLHARNNNGAPAAFTNKRIAFASVGLPLTATERTAYYNAVQNLQINLQRNV